MQAADREDVADPGSLIKILKLIRKSAAVAQKKRVQNACLFFSEDGKDPLAQPFPHASCRLAEAIGCPHDP